MNWVKQQLANVAGTQEPIYGPSAIHSVAHQAQSVPYTELTRDDLKWAALSYTCVETQTFYITADSGHVAMAQVIYSNVAGVRTTCQFNSKVFYPNSSQPPLWCSDQLDHTSFSPSKHSFHADNCDVVLAEDGHSFSIKSSTSKRNVVDITFSRLAPGFVVGHDGTTTFGTDSKNPWGSMRHAFWPRCRVEGSFMTQAGELSMSGFGLFIHALQGMKPHHAAATWNFANFQSPTHSAVMMAFTTPPSYGSTTVNVSGLATDGHLFGAGAAGTATRRDIVDDPEAGWPEARAATFSWTDATGGAASTAAELSGPLGARVDRVDIMAEVPKFVKTIVAGAAGTRPYIYQYITDGELQVTEQGGETRAVKGKTFVECTMISG